MVAMPPNIEIMGEDEAYQVAAAFQALINTATYADTTATAFRKRIINLLRQEGLDASVGGLRGFFGESSDASRTADRVVQPLRAIHADLENVARNGVLLRNRAQSLVFDPVREARRQRTRPNGETLRVR